MSNKFDIQRRSKTRTVTLSDNGNDLFEFTEEQWQFICRAADRELVERVENLQAVVVSLQRRILLRRHGE